MTFLPLLAKAASFVGSNLFPILATGFTAFSQLQAGKARQRDLLYQEELLKHQAKMEEFNAQEQINQLKKNVERDIQRARVRFASRGLKVDQLSALKAKEQSLEEESEDIDAIMFGSQQKSHKLNKEAHFMKGRSMANKRMTNVNILSGLGSSFSSMDFGSNYKK